MGAALVRFSPGGPSSAASMPPSGGHSSSVEQGVSALAATKSKHDTHGKSKGHKKEKPKNDKHGKGKGDKKDKPKGNKHGSGKGAKHGSGKGPKHGSGKDAKHGSGNDAKHGSGKDDKNRNVIGAKTTTVLAVADGRVEKANPTSAFDAAALEVDGAADLDVESYLLFDVAGITTPIQSATLRLWVPVGGDTVDGP